VDPPTRLAYSFVWEAQVALRQDPFKTDARRALHRDGWTDSFDKLERQISAS